MVFISLQPFAVQRVFLLIAAIICLLTASCFADSVFLTVRSTPHDRQMGEFARLISPRSNGSEHQVYLALENQWLEDFSENCGGFSQEWKAAPEAETDVSNPLISWTACNPKPNSSVSAPAFLFPYSGKYRAIASAPFARD
jgi:hypothetical protein